MSSLQHLPCELFHVVVLSGISREWYEVVGDNVEWEVLEIDKHNNYSYHKTNYWLGLNEGLF